MYSFLSLLVLVPSTIAIAIPATSPASSLLIPRDALNGQATFYGGNVAGGACSFSTYTLPTGIYGTALSDSNWANSAECGACVSVTGPGGNSITAMIVDECPGCGENHLDLFPDAFAALAPQSEGVISISWTYVDCPISTPLQLHNKDGISAYWFSMQVVNADKAVSTLEVSTDGGATWQGTTRQTYNFFENSSGFGTASVDVRVTSVDGDVVVVDDVPVSSGTSVTVSGNFGAGVSSASSSSSPLSNSASPTPTSTNPSTASTAPAAAEPSASTMDPATTTGPIDEEDDDTCDAE